MHTGLGGAVLVLGAVAAVPANAAVPADAAAATRLTVSVAPEISTGPAPKSVALECEPTGGTHPDAAAACDDLIKAGGDFRKIPPLPAGCPTYYSPVVATVQGLWRGTPISTSARYTNAVCANVQTGGHILHF
ncbi:SSI family serine proteinase inhibitor [Actinomadura luteofluorescens]|uniref:SSI family serine proteinase inhibitor n=1 Tax=Actinomadura luteofluorescens TaxID=46163 RepID=UPI003479FC84